MNLIKESHIHSGIDVDFLTNLPSAEEFKISVVESESVGIDHCLSSKEFNGYQEIYWAKRDGRPNFSRMVKGVMPSKTNKIVVVEVPHEDSIVVATAYFGREVAGKEPFEADWSVEQCEAWCKENPYSFWGCHALVEEGKYTLEQIPDEGAHRYHFNKTLSRKAL